MSELLVDVQGLHAGYDGIAVVRDLDLTVGPGEVVALLGPNGAGKTTTLLTISGLLAPIGGSVEVLGSPRLVALCEEACCNALEHALEDGTTTVGMRIQFDHLQPTPVGAEVVAEAVLEKIEGRRLKFTVSASDTGGLVAAGKITRVLVDLDRFMAKCCAT